MVSHWPPRLLHLGLQRPQDQMPLNRIPRQQATPRSEPRSLALKDSDADGDLTTLTGKTWGPQGPPVPDHGRAHSWGPGQAAGCVLNLVPAGTVPWAPTGPAGGTALTQRLQRLQPSSWRPWSLPALSPQGCQRRRGAASPPDAPCDAAWSPGHLHCPHGACLQVSASNSSFSQEPETLPSTGKTRGVNTSRGWSRGSAEPATPP